MKMNLELLLTLNLGTYKREKRRCVIQHSFFFKKDANPQNSLSGILYANSIGIYMFLFNTDILFGSKKIYGFGLP